MRDLLNRDEQERRQAILSEIERNLERNGPRQAQAYPDRARQFMPFAALRGYETLINELNHRDEDSTPLF